MTYLEPTISTEREGFLRVYWRAFGELRRPMQTPGWVDMPTPPGQGTTLGEGYALTVGSAERQARRAIRRWGR